VEGSFDVLSAFPIIVRWANLFVAFLLLGIVVFRVYVLRLSADSLIEGQVRERAKAAEARLRRLTIDAAMAMIILVGVQAAVASTGPRTADALWRFLIGTAYGWGILIRAGLGIVVLLAENRARPSFGISTFAAGLALSAFTLTSHAARTSSLAVLADWIHLLAASIWVGGLLSLLVVLQGTRKPDRPQVAHVLVPRFSTLAGASLCALVLTGLFLTWLFVADASILTHSTYGRKLMTKFLFVAVMAGLGVANRLLFLPELRLRAAFPPAQSVLRLVKAEVGLGALVLLVVAIPAIAPPGRVDGPERNHRTIRAEVLALHRTDVGAFSLAPDRVPTRITRPR
jgi:copper transport protein